MLSTYTRIETRGTVYIMLCWVRIVHSFIHSFIQAIYSAYSPLLLRSAPNTARILCRSFTQKRHGQLRVKDFPKVPAWRLERNSNPRPFERKASNLLKSHHASQLLRKGSTSLA